MFCMSEHLYLAKHSKSALSVPAQGAIFHLPKETASTDAGKIGENIFMRTRDTFTLYSYLCEEQLALWSYIWYCLNWPWICTSASKTVMFTSCSYIFWIILSIGCESGFTVYGNATHPHSEIMVISNVKKKKIHHIMLLAEVVMLTVSYRVYS